MYINREWYIPDCNRCDTDCTGKRRKKTLSKCVKHTLPKEGFMLAELTLVHATNLNKALSALPFNANLNFYLK